MAPPLITLVSIVCFVILLIVAWAIGREGSREKIAELEEDLLTLKRSYNILTDRESFYRTQNDILEKKCRALEADLVRAAPAPVKRYDDACGKPLPGNRPEILLDPTGEERWLNKS